MKENVFTTAMVLFLVVSAGLLVILAMNGGTNVDGYEDDYVVMSVGEYQGEDGKYIEINFNGSYDYRLVVDLKGDPWTETGYAESIWIDSNSGICKLGLILDNNDAMVYTINTDTLKITSAKIQPRGSLWPV